MKDLVEIDPTKLDVQVDYKYLSRQIVVTVKVLDDTTFNALVPEAQQLEAELKQVMKEAREAAKQSKD